MPGPLHILAVSALIAFAFAAPARAQMADAPGESAARDTVTVTGRRDRVTGRDAVEQAQALSRVSANELRDRAMARFAAPLCPGVADMRTEPAEAVVARIRFNAERLDVRLAEPDCSPNLVVVFAEDSRVFLNTFERDRPRRFSLVEAEEREELLDSSNPVRVWSHVEPVWADGAPLPRHGDEIEVPGAEAKRIFLHTRTDIRSALVVFDRAAVLGLSLDQLADYATMRGLSHTRPATGGEAMQTILALFEEGGAGIDGLTRFDLGYLGSLYYSPPNVSARTMLARTGRRAMDDTEDGDAN